MSIAIQSQIRDAQGRAITTLPIAVRQALMAADEILRLHGMQFELLCETCQRANQFNPNAWTVTPQHGNGDGSMSELLCSCTRRRFLSAF